MSCVLGILYNYQQMRYAGENGVAAYGVIMYVGFLFFSLFIGYCVGVSPVISYNYGADNRVELHNVLEKSCKVIAAISVAFIVLTQTFAHPLSGIFVGYDAELWTLTEWGFRICVCGFTLGGFCMFGSSLFTALNNGFLSAVLSFGRTVVFELFAILVLPCLFGISGVWFSELATETAAFILTIFIVILKRKKYGYT